MHRERVGACVCVCVRMVGGGDYLGRVNSVVNGALHIVEQLHSAAAQHDGGHLALVLQLLEDGHLLGPQLLHEHLVRVAHLVGRGRPDSHERSGAHGAAQAPQLKL